MARPIGITVVSIVAFLTVARDIYIDIGLVAKGTLTPYLHLTYDDAAIPAMLILVMIAYPTLYALAGWGLWKMKNWGRVLTLGLMVSACAYATTRWALTHSFTPASFLQSVLELAISIAIAVYLLGPRVKAAFSPQINLAGPSNTQPALPQKT